MTDDPYTYPDKPDVLINRFDIRDAATLEHRENLIVAWQLTRPVQLTLSPGGIAHIHRHLFEQIYPWAGEFRSVDMTKPGASFCRPWFIDQEMKKLTSAMVADSDLKSKDLRKFAATAAKYSVELHAIHPFREGNSRTNRLMVKLLADEAGHKLRIPETADERWRSAAQIGLVHDKSGPMADLIENYLYKGRENEPDKGR